MGLEIRTQVLVFVLQAFYQLNHPLHLQIPSQGTQLLPIQLLRNLGLGRGRGLDPHHTARHRQSGPSLSFCLEPLFLPPPHACSSGQAAALTERPGPPEQLTVHSGTPHTLGLGVHILFSIGFRLCEADKVPLSLDLQESLAGDKDKQLN